MNNIAIISYRRTFDWILKNCIVEGSPIHVWCLEDVLGRNFDRYFIDFGDNIKDVDKILEYFCERDVSEIKSLKLKEL